MVYDKRHGGAWDRGSADCYYGRPRLPHFYRGDTGSSVRVAWTEMTAEQVAEYDAGYAETEASGDRKAY